jgi:hypothetical protein
MPQLKEGTMKKANHIKNMELFDCEISGTVSNCDIYRCKMNSCRINKCSILEASDIEGSKVENTTLKPGTVLIDCYVNNVSEVIDCKMLGGVIRKGIIGKNAEISDYTLIVDAKGFDEKKNGESYANAFSRNNKPIK